MINRSIKFQNLFVLLLKRKIKKQYQGKNPSGIRICQKHMKPRLLGTMDSKECFSCKYFILNEGICDPL